MQVICVPDLKLEAAFTLENNKRPLALNVSIVIRIVTSLNC